MSNFNIRISHNIISIKYPSLLINIIQQLQLNIHLDKNTSTKFHLFQIPLRTPLIIPLRPSNSTNIIKLVCELQLTLGSLGQFLLTNIYLSKLFDCKWHLFKFVSIPTKSNIFSVVIWDPTMKRIQWARNAIIRNKDSWRCNCSKICSILCFLNL